MALDDCVSYDGDLGGMELSIPAVGSGFTINDILCDGVHGIMELSVLQVTQGTPSDMLSGWFADSCMELSYAYVWPDESEVKSGVVYGVTAERTGTYAGGYPRGRVVNESH